MALYLSDLTLIHCPIGFGERLLSLKPHNFKCKALSQYLKRYIFSASLNKATILVEFDSAQSKPKKLFDLYICAHVHMITEKPLFQSHL